MVVEKGEHKGRKSGTYALNLWQFAISTSQDETVLSSEDIKHVVNLHWLVCQTIIINSVKFIATCQMLRYEYSTGHLIFMLCKLLTYVLYFIDSSKGHAWLLLINFVACARAYTTWLHLKFYCIALIE